MLISSPFMIPGVAIEEPIRSSAQNLVLVEELTSWVTPNCVVLRGNTPHCYSWALVVLFARNVPDH